MLRRTYKFRLYPTARQEKLLLAQLRFTRELSARKSEMVRQRSVGEDRWTDTLAGSDDDPSQGSPLDLGSPLRFAHYSAFEIPSTCCAVGLLDSRPVLAVELAVEPPLANAALAA